MEKDRGKVPQCKYTKRLYLPIVKILQAVLMDPGTKNKKPRSERSAAIGGNNSARGLLI